MLLKSLQSWAWVYMLIGLATQEVEARGFLDLTSSKTSMGNIEDLVSKQTKHMPQKRASKACINGYIRIKHGSPIVRFNNVPSVPPQNSVVGPGESSVSPGYLDLEHDSSSKLLKPASCINMKITVYLLWDFFKYYFYILRCSKH